jgi:glutamate--cysteine ligase
VAAFQQGTAAVRICLDAGLAGPGPGGFRDRWALAHSVGPVLTAAFANSPLRAGRPTGWRCTRQALRLRLDRPAAGPAATGAAGLDPQWAWARYALDATVTAGPAAPRAISFREWTRGPAARRPRLADLRRHLDSLPAPVRARGHLELSMADAQPGDGWLVALATTVALLDDARAADEAREATEPLHAGGRTDWWGRAARLGLTDPTLAAAARHCFLAGYAALARHGVARDTRDAVARFIERYVNRARCPADDVLDAVAA